MSDNPPALILKLRASSSLLLYGRSCASYAVSKKILWGWRTCCISLVAVFMISLCRWKSPAVASQQQRSESFVFDETVRLSLVLRVHWLFFPYPGRIDSKSSHRHESIHHSVVGPESKHSFPPSCHCLDVLVLNKAPDREVEVSQE